jgi:AraC-like DNA-binding protein
MPSSRSFTFSDPLPYQAALRISDVAILPTAKGDFRAELTQLEFDKLWMQRGRENLPHVVVGKIGSHRKSISFLTKEQDMTYCGQPVPAGSIVVQRADPQHRQNPANRNWGSMSLPNDEFYAAFKAVAGCEFPNEPFSFVVQPDPEVMSRLLEVHETAGMIAQTAPDIFALREVGRSLEQKLIHLMIRSLIKGYSSTVSVRSRRHDRIVARFEAFLEANADQALYLTEVCAALGVAERTLRGACEEHLGMGPIRYLTLRRMHLLRHALLRAEPSKFTVTQIATDYGFWELGRFSVAYRTLFGESPSVSLQAPPVDRSTIVNRPSSLAASAYGRSSTGFGWQPSRTREV